LVDIDFEGRSPDRRRLSPEARARIVAAVKARKERDKGKKPAVWLSHCAGVLVGIGL
jgi:hypothetical protein